LGRTKPNKSLKQQLKEVLDEKLAIGESRYQAKLNGTANLYIFAWETYRAYLKWGCYFVEWAKAQPIDARLGHKPRTLEECRLFAEKWLQYNIDKGLSSYTIKLELAALSKIYGCTSKDFDIQTPSRLRSNITRSRKEATRDKMFSVEANKNIITFARCTGLRRAELAQIRSSDLLMVGGKPYLLITRGSKGGKHRLSPVVGSKEEVDLVIALCKNANGKVFKRVPSKMDVHSFRAEYTKRVYNLNKRELDVYKNERIVIHNKKIIGIYTTKNGRKSVAKLRKLCEEKGISPDAKGLKDLTSAYYCRNDMKGVVYDKLALHKASLALGHNRINVIAEHYLIN
jgi:integrase